MSKYIKPEELLESMRDCYQKKIGVLAERHKKALAQIDEMALQLSRYFSDAFVAMPTDEIKTKIMLPKIVRCEDCANSSFDEFGVGWCSENCREVKPCDYCVWGDRK